MLLKSFIFSPMWSHCISILCHSENNLQTEALQSTLPALIHCLWVWCLPRWETAHHSSTSLYWKLLETAFRTDLPTSSLQMCDISSVFSDTGKVWHNSQGRSYLPKISRSNMIMNIIQLINTLTRCHSPSLLKDKLHHTSAGRWCWGQGDLALLKGTYQSCPGICTGVVQKAGGDIEYGREGRQWPIKVLKIIMKNLESEVLSWLNPDCDKLKDHVLYTHLWASYRSNSLVN